MPSDTLINELIEDLVREDTNVRFAFQVALGTINNAFMNRPGPIFIGPASFVEYLARGAGISRNGFS